MTKKILIQFVHFLNGEKTDNGLSDFYHVAIFHLLNPCNRKDKHDLHNKICMCKQTYRESAELSEKEITSMNWENLCNWYKLNLNKHCLEVPQPNITLVFSCFGTSVAEVLQVSTPFMFSARHPESGKWTAAESTSCSVCLATHRLTRVVDKRDWCRGRSSQWQYWRREHEKVGWGEEGRHNLACGGGRYLSKSFPVLPPSGRCLHSHITKKVLVESCQTEKRKLIWTSPEKWICIAPYKHCFSTPSKNAPGFL